MYKRFYIKSLFIWYNINEGICLYYDICLEKEKDMKNTDKLNELLVQSYVLRLQNYIAQTFKEHFRPSLSEGYDDRDNFNKWSYEARTTSSQLIDSIDKVIDESRALGFKVSKKLTANEVLHEVSSKFGVSTDLDREEEIKIVDEYANFRGTLSELAEAFSPRKL